MPQSVTKVRIKDLPALTKPSDLLGKIIEAESASGTDQNYKIGVPLLVQTIAANLPAPQKVTQLNVRTYDATDPHYNAGFPATLVSESLVRDLVLWMTAYVEFPYPSQQYRLIYDSAGTYLAYADTTYSGTKFPCKWVVIGSDADTARSFQDFSPFTEKYHLGDTVKYTLNGQVRLFAAKLDLVRTSFPTNQQPAPTGLLTDVNWSEINAELAPNFSRLGQITCRYYTNAQRAADTYQVGDTVEDLVAREVAGANILYTNRTVTVELGPDAGTYRVAFDGSAAPAFSAYLDGKFADGKIPAQLVKQTGDEQISLTGITENVGGFRAGDSFLGSAQELAERLLITYQTPGFSSFQFAGSGSQNVLAGTSYAAANYLFTWSTSNSQNVLPNSLTLRDYSLNQDLVKNGQNDGNETISLPGFALDLGQTKTFQLTASDTQQHTLAAQITLVGVLARYYGASAQTPSQFKQTLTSASALNANALGLARDLVTSQVNNITVDCSGGKYVYFLYDARFPTPTTVRAGLNSFSAYTLETIALHDELGNSRSYKLLYTDVQFGQAVNVNVVA